MWPKTNEDVHYILTLPICLGHSLFWSALPGYGRLPLPSYGYQAFLGYGQTRYLVFGLVLVILSRSFSALFLSLPSCALLPRASLSPCCFPRFFFVPFPSVFQRYEGPRV